ncbi:MAG: hypothetical protein JWN68_1754 [Nocardioides sp.]|jgi:hypothetical protein|uniref:Pr6Pr family membrane protein n=1 Tax=Nocardioides sp. TaxID=35761 RepID=UPI00262A416E|nr:Pr6Pr family membrane protein [Nocardioides sp.]MCW2833801.1 hypothetical protein [Nocardioides sp.]
MVAALAIGAVVFQLVLVCLGGTVLDETNPPDLMERVVRFFVAWLAYTLVRGAITEFYPYPFLDADVEGYAAVSVVSLGIAVLFVGLAALAWRGDAALGRRRHTV